MNQTATNTSFDKQLFTELYGPQPQGINCMKPIWSDDGVIIIIDFEFVYSNREGFKFLDLTPEQHSELRLSNTSTLTGHQRKQVLEEMIHVYLTGESSTTNIYNLALNKYARLMRSRLRDVVLTVVEDRT